LIPVPLDTNVTPVLLLPCVHSQTKCASAARTLPCRPRPRATPRRLCHWTCATLRRATGLALATAVYRSRWPPWPLPLEVGERPTCEQPGPRALVPSASYSDPEGRGMHRNLFHVELPSPYSLSLLANRWHGKASTFVKLQTWACVSVRREKASSRPLDVDTHQRARRGSCSSCRTCAHHVFGRMPPSSE
jgi:hypothetical protein